jgi:hypothetical protein
MCKRAVGDPNSAIHRQPCARHENAEQAPRLNKVSVSHASAFGRLQLLRSWALILS